MSSAKVALAAVVFGLSVAGSPEPAAARRLLGFERNVVVGPYYSGFPGYYAVPGYYPPYVAYEPGAYFRPEYLPGANWRDNWYDATRKKVHGFTLR